MREAGVLCHITSLPSGKLGPDAFTFIDLISEAGITVWQVLPITPPDEHRSPYASTSAFAGWVKLCDPSFEEDPSHDLIREWLSVNAHWAWDWGLYDVLKQAHGEAPWFEWPEPLRDRHPEAIEAAIQQYMPQIRGRIMNQVRFQRDWMILRHYASEKGVKLFGDLPIFVAKDSVDVWVRPHLFRQDVVAGVPPDYFSEDGQRWGTMLYDWDAHRKEDWTWWRMRMARTCGLFDIVRIDHFRGFEAAWAIPEADDTAKNGEWCEGPRDEIVQALLDVSGDTLVVAEDLGIIPQSVIDLRKRHNLPGMAVLHFAFDDANMDNPHRPENISKDSIVYTGTHDNDTTMGWWDESGEERKERVMKHGLAGESAPQTLIRIAMESASPLAIVPLQDVLELGNESRMNTPGKTTGNWTWRFDWTQLSEGNWELFTR
ncbi:MAG: 4-alpha-glucanotransferase [Candidatus Thermoplasmatota archaeon]|nr:4-alpha-glucanotransferase [Candidatus Thermoplasmatota archaeon]MEE3083401.1 4-alpha-glucanotransferase [Candidatus Thermoplasmatota archaeon]